MFPDPERVAHRWRIRSACRKVIGPRVASTGHQGILEAFGDVFIERTAAFGHIVKKLKELLHLLKRAPQALARINDMVGSLSPENLRKWAQEGKEALTRALRKAARGFPLGLFFHPKVKLPTLTDLVARILKDTRVGELLATRVKPRLDSLDKLLKKHLPTLRRPLYAAIFIWVWLNVVEISWDPSDLFEGFTGNRDLSSLLSSMPESALGALLATLGLGFHFLPVILVARLTWLVANNYLEWNPASGAFTVHWNLLGVFESHRAE